MTTVLTLHAKKQLIERKLSETFVLTSVKKPTLVKKQKDGRFQYIKSFKQRYKLFLLVCIVEKSLNTLTVITVFKTSKIKKYL